MGKRLFTTEQKKHHSEIMKQKWAEKNGKWWGIKGSPLIGITPYNKGKKGISEETRRKMSEKKVGYIPWNKGKKYTEEEKKKYNVNMSGCFRHLGNRKGALVPQELRDRISKTLVKVAKRGKESPFWIRDRNKLSRHSKNNSRWSYAYLNWIRQVRKRDEYRCKISNRDCNGRLETHHILDFKNHPELRYDINNGITLCHAHHPRRRAEEKRLVPTFKELVSVSK